MAVCACGRIELSCCVIIRCRMFGQCTGVQWRGFGNMEEDVIQVEVEYWLWLEWLWWSFMNKISIRGSANGIYVDYVEHEMKDMWAYNLSNGQSVWHGPGQRQMMRMEREVGG